MEFKLFFTNFNFLLTYLYKMLIKQYLIGVAQGGGGFIWIGIF